QSGRYSFRASFQGESKSAVGVFTMVLLSVGGQVEPARISIRATTMIRVGVGHQLPTLNADSTPKNIFLAASSKNWNMLSRCMSSELVGRPAVSLGVGTYQTALYPGRRADRCIT